MSGKRTRINKSSPLPLPINNQSVNPDKQLAINVQLNGFIDKWLNYCRAVGLSDKSIKDYENAAFKFLWWYKENVNLEVQEMTVDHAMAFVGYLKKKQQTRWGEPIRPGREKLSPASIATYGRTIRTFFNWLEDRHLIEFNPFNREVKFTSKKEPVIGRHHKNLQEEQLSKIFAYLTQPERLKRYNGARDLAIVTLLLDSGMRKGELLSMRVGDIDWYKKRIDIRGKTGERTCFFSPLAEEALLLYHDIHRKEQKSLLALTAPYWLTSDNNELSSSGLSNSLYRVSRGCGFNFGAHKFRHTFASVMVSQVGVYELKELLGHSSITTTMVYTHGSPDKLQDSFRGKSPLSILDVGQLKPKTRRGRPRREQ